MEVLWKVIIRNILFKKIFDSFCFHSGWLSEHCKDPNEIHRHWSEIPIDTDILLTHGPPYSILDQSLRTPHLGCKELLKSVSTIVQPKLHVFGHVHGGHGQLKNEAELGKTLFVNASLCDSKFHIVHSPIVIDLTKEG
jgi:Icc-related predicted phosphoesterase